MMNEVLQGVQLGLVLALLVGPVFFTILQTSIQHGFWKGVLLVLGVSLSDLCIILLCYLGLASLVADSQYRQWLGYGGGVLLILFGLNHLVLKTRAKAIVPEDPVKANYGYRFVIKGFLINGMTPTVLFFWLATFSFVSVQYAYTRPSQYMGFFASVLATVLATDILKAWLAGRLSQWVTPKVLKVINILLGIVLVSFGIKLLFGAGSF